MNQSDGLRLGFDGGGTKTRAVVMDAARRIRGEGASGSSNFYSVGMEAALDNIESAARQALAEAGVAREAVSGWGLGLGGVCSPAESAEVEAALRARLGAGPRIVAVEDVVSAWTGAFGGVASGGVASGAARVVCIAGTGIGCWGKNAAGEVAQGDGAGPILGDRGSGYWIGERALRHAARVCDGVAPADNLSAAVLAHFGATDIKALIRAVYAPGFERSRIAELAPVALAHADVPLAREILTRAGEELALTSLAVLRRLRGQAIRNGEAPMRGEVALTGSVLAHAAPVRATFVARLQAGAGDIAFVEARYEPAVGAALLLD